MMRTLLAALAAASSLLVPSSAQAADPCPRPYMTVAEFEQIREGQSPAQVTRIVGSFGKYARTDRSEAGRPVFLFAWRYCRAGEGWEGADQWLGFERVGGVWMLTEIR